MFRSRRILIAGLAVIITAGALLWPSFSHLMLAQDSPTATPNINWVSEQAGINVRGGPGLNYGAIGQLPLGSWVQPLARSLDGDWILITYRTTTGWVFRDNVSWRLDTDALPLMEVAAPTPIPRPIFDGTPAGPTYTPNANWVRVGLDGANVRAGPAQGYLPIGELFTGDVVAPVARDRGANWVMIRYGSGYGWIRADLVVWITDIEALPVVDVPNLTPSFTPVPRNLTRSPTATRTSTLTRTPTITPTATASRTPSQTPPPTNTLSPTPAPTDTATVEPTATAPPTNTRTPEPSATNTPRPTPTSTPLPTRTPIPVAVAGDPITVYWGPGTNYEVVTTVPAGTPMNIVGQGADGGWWVVVIGEQIGWVPMEAVSTSGDPDAVPVLSAPPPPTNTRTPTPTTTRTPTDTPVPTPSDTPTATVEPTATRTPLPSATPTNAPTDTPTDEPTRTPLPTGTPTTAPTDTATPTDTPPPTPTATQTATATPAPTDTPTAAPTDTATIAPSETPTWTPSATPTAEPSATPTTAPTVTPEPSATPQPSATETPLAVAVIEPGGEGDAGAVAPPAPGTDPEPAAAPVADDDGPAGIALTPLVIVGVLAVLALAYVGTYAAQAARLDSYREGFILNRCPVCEEGNLLLEERRYRSVGIPRVRRVVRCDRCHSVLREVGRQRWRYAIDRAANPAMFDRLNGEVVTEHQLLELSPEYEAPPPQFIDDEPNE